MDAVIYRNAQTSMKKNCAILISLVIMWHDHLYSLRQPELI